jgi:hypothetical protein
MPTVCSNACCSDVVRPAVYLIGASPGQRGVGPLWLAGAAPRGIADARVTGAGWIPAEHRVSPARREPGPARDPRLMGCDGGAVRVSTEVTQVGEDTDDPGLDRVAPIRPAGRRRTDRRGPLVIGDPC